MDFMNVYRPVGPTGSIFVIQPSTRGDVKTQRSGQRLKMSLGPEIFVFIPGEWCVTHP